MTRLQQAQVDLPPVFSELQNSESEHISAGLCRFNSVFNVYLFEFWNYDQDLFSISGWGINAVPSTIDKLKQKDRK